MAINNSQQHPKMNQLEVLASERMSQVPHSGSMSQAPLSESMSQVGSLNSSYISESEPSKHSSNVFGGCPTFRGKFKF